MPDYTLQPATASDAESILVCADRAYASNLLTQATFPEEYRHRTSADDLYAWKISTTTTRLNMQDAGYLKAVSTDSPDQILGFVGWYRPGHFTPQTQKEVARPCSSSAELMKPCVLESPTCMDKHLHNCFLEELDRQRWSVWGEDMHFYYLAVLAVDPQFQRQGIGEALLRSVVQLAEKDCLPMYAEASPEGARLYEKTDFTEARSFALLEGSHIVRCFVRW